MFRAMMAKPRRLRGKMLPMPDKQITPEQVAANRELLQHTSAWIRHRGLTQEQVANNLGVSKGLFSKYLSGKTPMSLAKFKAMAAMLHATPEQLMFDPNDNGQDAAYERITRVMKELDPRLKERWIEAGEALAGLADKKVS